ncbi:MAG: transketolase [Bdellovibrionales bacterium]|nr:transketolase [Bdellovibrionales bacterium]
MPFVRKQLFSNPLKNPQFSVNLRDKFHQNFCLADPKANRALLACMNMEASLNGAASHWGGPSAFAEILSALYALVFDKAQKEGKNWHELFHLINDAGHCENGLYALKANYGLLDLNLEKLKAFRSLQSPLTGHGEVHTFPESLTFSNGPLGSTVAQAQGLAMADKLLGLKKVTILTMSDGACMEGESHEAFHAIPGLARKNKINPFLLIISYNNTKLTGRIDKDTFCLKPFLKSLSVLGWNSSFIEEGNDLKKVFDSIQSALLKSFQNPCQPLALIFKTCKGFGVKQTEQDISGGHGFPLKKAEELLAFVEEIYSGEKIPSKILNWIKEIQKPKKKNPPNSKYFKNRVFEKVQVGVSKALIEQKEKGKPLVSISSDLFSSTGLAPFRQKFPELSFDMGVAEANMISVAGGFSKTGFIPVVDTFSQFAVTKGSLPLLMSALSQAPILGIFSHAGFQDSADGASHQALSYFAKTCAIPFTKVYALSCSEEAYHLIFQAIEDFHEKRQKGLIPKSYLFFLGRETFPSHFDVSSYSLNQAQVILDESQGKKPVLVVTCGALLWEAYRAVKKLKDKGKGAVLINSSCVSHPDFKTLSKYLNLCEGRILIAEDHQEKAGLASQILLTLKDCFPSQIKHLAVRGEIGRSAYTAKELYRKFQLDSEAIFQNLLSFS